ncbi:MAG: DNA polymerase I [Woeseia sp.]|nr:DNA polymerase I [Woeseia sp.]MBT8095786.1 DNA polymerase I [Woeseia sp.]NNE61764.1 DNA polymerase I [Woeseia sp.]NNL54177.1 DNA polymerase I [Woeseia sp.]
MSNNKLVLVDGSSYLYRAFHALPPLTNSSGEPTGALHGVLNMLTKLMREEPDAHIAVVFDAPGKTFRDKLFEDYKANRPPMPDELRSQITPLLEAVPALGLPMIRLSGVEADDVIGTLCKRAVAAGMDVLVSTGDKDMAQLVNDGVTLVNTMTDTVMDRDGVHEKFDVWPEQIIDYLALVGDKSDNIPGVPKVGPKTAAKWLKKYGSVENLVEHADDIGGKVGESLRENLEQLRLSQQLATIQLDVELDEKPAALTRTGMDAETLGVLYERFELRSLARQLEKSSATPENAPSASAAEEKSEIKGDYETVLTAKSLDKWLKKIASAELVALDTETTSLDYMTAEMVGISLAVTTGEAAYIPLAHDYPGAPDQLERDLVLKKMKNWLQDPEAAKVGHHLKYDAHIFARYGIHLAGMHYDSMLESYVLNSVATRHDMDSTARHYLGIETIHFEDVAGKGAKQLTFNQIDLEQAAPYAAEDADITLRLHQKLWSELGKVGKLRSLYQSIEQPLVPVLFAMEETGVLVDRAMLKKQSSKLAKTMQKLEKEAHEAAGGPFNLSSPKQLQQILFEDQGLPIVRKTPKGQPSTAEDVLQELAADYDLPRVILEYRSVAKLKSTYTDKLPLQICKETGRIHTSYHQAVAATGRLSSTDPNLQNIPIRTEEGRRIRKAFVCPEGSVLLAADYSQIELRIMAHLSGDAGLLEAFNEDQDVHQATAAEVFEVEIDKVTSDQRRSAKAINFGLMYGMSAFGLAKQLGTTRGEAQEYVDLYFDRYPGVKAYMDNIRAEAREAGFVETLFGRRLYLPQINDRNAQRRQYSERSAINAPMQGTAADIIKMAMISVHDWLAESKAPAKLIMQVHDELVLEVDEAACDEVREEIISRMCAAGSLKVPLVVDAGVGNDWDEAH